MSGCTTFDLRKAAGPPWCRHAGAAQLVALHLGIADAGAFEDGQCRGHEQKRMTLGRENVSDLLNRFFTTKT
jgi:hypothetical protein